MSYWKGHPEYICIPDLLEVDIVAAGPMVHDAGLSATEYQVRKQAFRNILWSGDYSQW